MYILVLAAPPSQTVARITLVQNWEGTPTKAMSDIISLSYNTFPADFDGKMVYDYMISNNLVVTTDEKEFGLYKFAEQIKRY